MKRDFDLFEICMVSFCVSVISLMLAVALAICVESYLAVKNNGSRSTHAIELKEGK